MELQRQRSFNTSTVSHDFRKEYKGSFLEKKCKKMKEEVRKNGLKSIAEWFISKASTKKNGKPGTSITSSAATRKTAAGATTDVAHEQQSYFDRIPNEIVFEILKNCKSADPSSVLAVRKVSRRLNACMDHIADSDVNVNVVSRLVISGLGRKGFEMRWINYEVQKSKTTIVPWSTIKSSTSAFEFNFRRFSIRRILLRNLSLSDDLIDFLRRQFQFADLSKLIRLSLFQVDFSSSNSLSLHRLLAPLAKTLEIFEITECTGMVSDSVTDEHLAQLDAAIIKRICIDGVKFASGTTKSLNIGDGALRRFARLGAFPTLILDRCAVTTNTVCDYTKKWFEQCNESEKQLRSHVCTVKRCPKVKGSLFESECRRRGLQCKNRRGSGSLTLYNVQKENTIREFTIALAALEDKEISEKPKISEEQTSNCNILAVPSF